jgi:hypothetical protein
MGESPPIIWKARAGSRATSVQGQRAWSQRQNGSEATDLNPSALNVTSNRSLRSRSDAESVDRFQAQGLIGLPQRPQNLVVAG